MQDVMTVELLKEALSHVFHEDCEIEDDWISNIAQFIMDFFGYEERILDNDLTSKDRDIFYMLEGVGLLKTEMEEATILKGKVWRIHYWILNNDKIKEIANKKSEDICADPDRDKELYDSLSDKIWARN